MLEVVFRTFFLCFLMEIGSASSFTIAALANSSPKWPLILAAGILGILAADILALKAASLISRLPVSPDLISGVILTMTGMIFLFKGAR